MFRLKVSSTSLLLHSFTPPLLLCLLALAVRLYNLTYHSLWFDEVVSTGWAGRPAGEIWRVGLALVEDKHPPLYYLMLHGWTALFGGSDPAVRSLGVLLGALAILPAYGIARRLGGVRAAVLGCLFLALNPFLAWYSQEARMFMPATTFLLVGLWGILEIGDFGVTSNLQSPISNLLVPWTAAVLGFTAALYSYLFSAFMLPVAGAWAAIVWWAGRQRPGAKMRLAASAAALLVVALLFLPLARSAWSVSGAESAPGRAFAGMWPALADLVRIYSFGWPHWPQPWVTIATLAAGIALILGLLVPPKLVFTSTNRRAAPTTSTLPDLSRNGASARLVADRRLSIGGLLLAAWFAVPILIGGLLLARDRTVFAESRYFIFLVPALCIAWGRAIAMRTEIPAPRSPARVMAALPGYITGAALLAVVLLALPSDWAPQNRREAWRESAAFLAAHAGPNDAIVVQADYVQPAFQRYFKGPQPVFSPFTGPLADQEQVDPPLAGLAGYDAVWLVQSHDEAFDPGNLVAGWFGARFPLITEAYPPGVQIRGFAQRYRTSAAPAGLIAVTGALGPMRLAGAAYQPQTLRPRDEIYHPPSNWIHVATYWGPSDQGAAAGTGPEPVPGLLPGPLPVIRLVDAGGQVWGESLVRPNDAFHVWPVSRWLPGEIVRADADVNLNPATPPGVYRLIVQAPGSPGGLGLGEVTIKP